MKNISRTAFSVPHRFIACADYSILQFVIIRPIHLSHG